jgi:hypothetical protein
VKGFDEPRPISWEQGRDLSPAAVAGSFGHTIIMLAFSRGIGEDKSMNAFTSSGMKSVSRREILRALVVGRESIVGRLCEAD